MNAKILSPIPLVVCQTGGSACFSPMVTTGVPFAQGTVSGVDGFRVVTQDGNQLPTSCQVTGHWPDGTIRWCLVRFLSSGQATDSTGYMLVSNSDSSDSIALLQVVDDASGIVVQDGAYEYRFSNDSDSFFPALTISGDTYWSPDDLCLRLRADAEQLVFKKSTIELLRSDAFSAEVEVSGEVKRQNLKVLNVRVRFEIVAGAMLTANVDVHNPRRALHKEGIWDLGDENSFLFDDFSLNSKLLATDELSIQVEPKLESIPLKSNKAMSLFQASSGGPNWDSPSHMNASGEVTNSFCGYQFSVDGEQLGSGRRAAPLVLTLREGHPKLSIRVREFWQNCPKSLSVSDNSLSIGLYPSEHTDQFELQGGERKQHQIVFSFGDNEDDLLWLDHHTPLAPDNLSIAQADVLGNPVGDTFLPYDRLIDSSLREADGFVAKREIQDEYGWRNFGDVVADHETLYHDGDDIFVSHYNNQYDPIYGFARQYLLTADQRWYRMMDQLARHVIDIDIYRTVEDRAEYNHGLFWHTDHYLKAFTSSHRTYSRSQYAEDHAGDKGGGPGSEHCYTTGLKVFYHLSGNSDARDSVLGLASWIKHYYEGTGTVAERCKDLLSRDRRSLISVCKGHKVFRYRYGFDRGVGNYIRALLDSYELTLDKEYIKQVEAIIQNTFGCADDISARDLEDVESTWFYTVFLQEVIRYLDTKRSIGSLDSQFCYARDGLLHYANWMVLNEQPTLLGQAKLEYPNDTWVAQDIRKANVLYAAYRYATRERDPLLARAREFRDYVTTALSQSDTLHFSRIQILLMQNHGPSALMDRAAEPYEGLATLQENSGSNVPCFYTIPGFFAYLLRSFGKPLKNLNPKRELKWVRTRLG